MRATLRQYAVFGGRATRPEYWWWQLGCIAAAVLTGAIDELTEAAIGFRFVGAVVSLTLLVPTLAVSVRRLHDSDLVGWWILAPLGVVAVGMGLFIGGFVATLGPLFYGGHVPGETLTLFGVVLFTAGAGVAMSSILVTIALMVRRSTPGPNRFGPPPEVS